MLPDLFHAVRPSRDSETLSKLASTVGELIHQESADDLDNKFNDNFELEHGDDGGAVARRRKGGKIRLVRQSRRDSLIFPSLQVRNAGVG